MKIDKINFLFYFKIYLTLLAFFAVFHLYFKHTGGTDSTISEWLVNYKGGFTRRGLSGEFFIFLSNNLNISIRFIIYLFQSFFYILFVFLTFLFFKNLKNISYIFLLIIFCPLFLIYHLAELEVLVRKEILLFLHFYVFLFLIERRSTVLTCNLFLFTTLPIIALIWEPIIFFIQFYFFSYLLSFHQSFGKIDKKLIYKHLFSYCSFLIVIFFIITQDFSKINEKIMCDYLEFNFNQKCYMSLNYLDTTISENFNSLFIDIKFTHITRYTIVYLIGFAPLFLLLKYSSLMYNKKVLNLKNYYLLLFIPIIFLYMMGLDWGRWTNITYFYYIITTFHLIKINKLKINVAKLHLRLNKFIKKKFILVCIFIFFCFGWNTKTLYKEDIGSFPGYRVPYFFFKTLIKNID